MDGVQTMEIFVSKLKETYAVEFEKLPEAMRQGIIEYGARQLLNDKCAGKDETESRAAVEQCLAALSKGEYRFGGGGGGKMLSPVEVEARMIVVGLLMKQKGMKKAEAVETAKAWRDVVKPEMADKILAKAGKNVAARDLGSDITL